MKLQVANFAANDRWKLCFLLQMVAASGFAANILFLLQVSYFAANDLLQIVELQLAKKAAFGLGANVFAANCLNLGRPQKPGGCKCPYTKQHSIS